MDIEDFRAIRRVLEPDDFAISDGKPDGPPRDLIEQQAWEHIMTLPGDVAIRITDHQGSRISLMHDLSSEWLFSSRADAISKIAVGAVWNNLESAIFNTVHGHYKTALTMLRVALETSIIAARCSIASDQQRWERWTSGGEFKFGSTCDEILKLQKVADREMDVFSQIGVGIFKGRNSKNSGSWARSLYGHLCQYSHARGDTTDTTIWNSNGPIYSANGFRTAYEVFLETYALMLILGRWSEVTNDLGQNGKLILRKDSLEKYLDQPFRSVATFYRQGFWAD